MLHPFNILNENCVPVTMNHETNYHPREYIYR